LKTKQHSDLASVLEKLYQQWEQLQLEIAELEE